MALERYSFPERITIVLNRDRSIRAIQEETLEVVEDDGVIIAAKQLPAAEMTEEALAKALPSHADCLAQVSAANYRLSKVNTYLNNHAEEKEAVITAAKRDNEARIVAELERAASLVAKVLK